MFQFKIADNQSGTSVPRTWPSVTVQFCKLCLLVSGLWVFTRVRDYPGDVAYVFLGLKTKFLKFGKFNFW